MTIWATMCVWNAQVKPKEKLILLFAANCGQGGMDVHQVDKLRELADFVGCSPTRASRGVERLRKKGLLELAPGSGRTRVKLDEGGWEK